MVAAGEVVFQMKERRWSDVLVGGRTNRPGKWEENGGVKKK